MGETRTPSPNRDAPSIDPDVSVVFAAHRTKIVPSIRPTQNPVTNLDTNPFSDSLVSRRMTPLRHLLAFLLLATAAAGNLYVPKAKLAGETVYVRLAKEAAVVSAVFEFEDWFTRDAKIVYFPIYANETDDPIQVLARAEFALDVGGTKLGVATPCEAPERFKKIPAGPRICWYSVNLDHMIDLDSVNFDGRIAVRLTYTQSLIRGRFYYLPVIIGHTELDQKVRPWRYQLLARSSARVVQVLSRGADYEQFGDSVAVYLKDGEVVEIQ